MYYKQFLSDGNIAIKPFYSTDIGRDIENRKRLVA